MSFTDSYQLSGVDIQAANSGGVVPVAISAWEKE